MGLIRAALNAAGGTLRDQYKEYIYCEALPTNVLIQRGTSQRYTGNTNHGNENVITDGSKVAVADGQCLLIVENGKIVDFCAETGAYVYNTGTSPSMLTGGMTGLKKSFSTLWNRIQSGGQQDNDQRVYYVNLKEIVGNKFGVGNVAFRDSEFNFTITLGCFGEYSYKITDPLMFYTNVCGNVRDSYTRDNIDSQFKAEVQSNLQQVLSTLASKRIPYDQITNYNREVRDSMNAELTAEWVEKRGISVESFAITVSPNEESKKKIEQFQSSRVYTDARMLGARIGEAQANAMENAASNTNGSMAAFMGMGMAQQAGGMNAAQLFNMGQQQQPQPQPGQQQPQPEQPQNQQPKNEQSQPVSKWTCSCGAENTGKFCCECGAPAPVPTKNSNTWVCSCGVENTGKFCSECGAKKPLDCKCETCGYEGDKPFKFCPECGAENKI